MQGLTQLKISGRVQGVFYRQSTKRKAQELGLRGWVRNKADGSVEALVAGPRADVAALVAWCKHGPPSAKVEALEVKWLDGNAAEGENLSEYELKFSEKFEIR
mgnify:CR=1 FL=1